MKVVISVLGDMYDNDGTSVRSKRIYELIKDKIDVKLVHRSNIDSSNSIISIKPKTSKLWNLKLIPFIFKNNFDFVYCSNDYAGFLTFFIFSKIYNYKIIFEAHGIKSKEYAEGAGLNKSFWTSIKLFSSVNLEKFVISHADHVIALSEDICDYYKQFNNKIDIIPVFLDEKEFKCQLEKKENKKKIVGLIGPFTNGNINVEFLNFLSGNINEFDERIKFVIIGKCDSKIKNKRILYTGYLNDMADYVSCLNSLDAVLVPSKYPSYGALNKILEPMACSVPVFTTSKGVVGLYNYENKKNIFIFKEENLVEGINKFIFDKNLMEKVAKESKMYFEKYYSKKVNEKKLLKIFKE